MTLVGAAFLADSGRLSDKVSDKTPRLSEKIDLQSCTIGALEYGYSHTKIVEAAT